MSNDPDCIFCKIATGQIPANVVYQDAQATAFRDINPQAPVHVLVVPNQHIANSAVLEADHDAIVGSLVRTAAEVARREGVASSGYRLVINTGQDAQNTVPHLHIHLLGGRPMTWPPG
jgi:histidine triad (HIT) family protein